MADLDDHHLFEAATAAIKSGDRAGGKRLLLQFIQANPRSEAAWLWLVETLPTDAQRMAALEQCLKLIPDSDAARQGLARLRKQQPPKVPGQQPVSMPAAAVPDGGESALSESPAAFVGVPAPVDPLPPQTDAGVPADSSGRQKVANPATPERIRLISLVIIFLALLAVLATGAGGLFLASRLAPRPTPDLTLESHAAGLQTENAGLRAALTARPSFPGAALSSTPLPSATHPTITSTFHATPSPSPSPTSTPTFPDATPVSDLQPLPMLENTPFPMPLQTMTASNTQQVVELARWGSGLPEQAAWSPDGKWLAVGGTLGVHLFDAQKFELAGFFDAGRWITTLAFSADSRTLVAGSSDGWILVWQVDTGELSWSVSAHTWELTWVLFSPDGGLLASSSKDGEIQLWDLATKTQLNGLRRIQKWATGIAFSHDGKLLATAWEDGVVWLWNIHTGIVEREFTGVASYPSKVTFSPDGTLLATGAANQVQLWQVSDGRLLQTLEAKAGVVGEGRGKTGLLRPKASDLAGIWPRPLAGGANYVNSLTFSPDGKLLAAATFDRWVRIWQVPTGELQYTLTDFERAIKHLSFSPGGDLLAMVGEDAAVHFWQVSSAAIVRTLPGFSGRINALAFSPAGQMLATAGEAGFVKVTDLSNGASFQL